MQENATMAITNSKVSDSEGKCAYTRNGRSCGKVKEKKMARLFENMDKIDIQEQRRKTEEERKRAEEAEQMVEKHWKKGLS